MTKIKGISWFHAMFQVATGLIQVNLWYLGHLSGCKAIFFLIGEYDNIYIKNSVLEKADQGWRSLSKLWIFTDMKLNIKHFSDNDEINQFFKGVCHISQLKINIFEKISSPLICIFQDAFFDVYHAHIKNFFWHLKGLSRFFFKKKFLGP